MLEFFRKYQRYFFVFITAVIISSFLFFGTFSTLDRETKKEDRCIGYTIDGSSLMLSEVRDLSRFIALDREDVFSGQSSFSANLCNDGVIRYDLLRSGLADLLVSSYFDSLKEDLSLRLERIKRFRPYVHSQIPILNAEAVWDRFLPEMKREVAALQKEAHISSTVFPRLSRLYQQQSYLTPESLRRVLLFQHQQLSGAKGDAELQRADLALFGFHSLADWFGRHFLDASAEFILNAAVFAEKKGYQVTLEEAKGDLLCNFQASMQRLAELHSAPELSLHQHLRSLGFDENSAAAVWRKVLLFRRYFQGISQASFVDRLPYRDFFSYIHEAAVIKLYQLPASLRLKTLQDLIEFQTYLSAVSIPSTDPLALPSLFYSSEEVGKKYPELVQATYRAKVGKIALSQVALRVPIKEVWDWQLDELNWTMMKNSCTFLPEKNSREERFQALESLNALQRSQVDGFSRLRLLNSYPEWIEEALLAASNDEQTISISQKSSSLLSIEKPDRLNDLLARAAVGDEEAKKELLRYSDDGKVVHRIETAVLVEPPHILTFVEAKRLNLLASISDRCLQEEYIKLRKASPSKFQSNEGEWKPFAAVKGQIAKHMFASVFQEIEKLDDRKWAEEPFDSYASYRMLPAARAALHTLQQNKELDSLNNPLVAQFQFESQEQLIHRTNQEKWMKESAFQMLPNEWSSIQVPSNGDIAFFYFIEKKHSMAPILDQISFGKELIAADAQRYLAERLLEKIDQTQSIVIPLQGEL